MPTCIVTCQSNLGQHEEDRWGVNIFGLTNSEKELMKSTYPELVVCGRGVSKYCHVGKDDSELDSYNDIWESITDSKSTHRDGVLSAAVVYLNYLEQQGYQVTKSDINVMAMDTRWTFVLQK
ncbi:uncharacterized protein LOC110862499 [Folsomia candida]|uniref:uncharacterized protein LOC110862499 n=1 Tax=Folsomia candida TaxID=158441 RepID=UPI000B8EED8F|nr:uncharacterized protein LOC110862499 [Folsomia candida]